MKMGQTIDFSEAERKARERDSELEKLKYKLEHGGFSQEDIEKALTTLAGATNKSYYIGTRRSPQSKLRFAQFLQRNWKFLSQKKYLSSGEKAFLVDIVPFIGFDSGCIVVDPMPKNTVPAYIKEIAVMTSRNRSNVNMTINCLVDKGILAKAASGVEGNNAKAYAIFVNPHVIYAGDKDNVNSTLQAMFFKAMKMDVLKDLPDKLF